MPDSLDLTGDIAAAVDSAGARGSALVVGYIGDDGFPALSFRGSTHVHGPGELAIWARKADEGLARTVAERPQVSLLYYAPDGPGPAYLAIQGRARLDSTADEDVYASISDVEKSKDPDRKGVAVIIDVDSVSGVGADGPFSMARDEG